MVVLAKEGQLTVKWLALGTPPDFGCRTLTFRRAVLEREVSSARPSTSGLSEYTLLNASLFAIGHL